MLVPTCRPLCEYYRRSTQLHSNIGYNHESEGEFQEEIKDKNVGRNNSVVSKRHSAHDRPTSKNVKKVTRSKEATYINIYYVDYCAPFGTKSPCAHLIDNKASARTSSRRTETPNCEMRWIPRKSRIDNLDRLMRLFCNHGKCRRSPYDLFMTIIITLQSLRLRNLLQPLINSHL